MSSTSAVDRLFSIPEAYAYTPENERLFLEAMAEMVEHHRRNSPVYDGICRQDGFSWDQVEEPDDVYRVPHIFVTAFKVRRLLSVPESEIVVTFTSSGTSGQKSQTNWDAGSRDRQAFSRKAVVESMGLADYEQPVNYLVLSYDPASGGTRGAAHAFAMYTTFAPAAETVFAITQGPDGQPRFQPEVCLEALERFAASGLPLRVVGFPAFGYMILKELDTRGVRLRFPPQSLMMLGGGWKQHTGQAIPPDQYRALVERVLGIPPQRVRDFYGMVEHGIPYLSCEYGHHHVPIYSRVCAVDPGTLEILPEGRVGLLKLITPYNRATPAISVLSTDLGELRSDCPCGRPGRYLVFARRGGVKKHAGCAISAAQLIGQ
jgi:phenylacetate-coenzyme A ligase PaaK-like adenylate-forming protein